MWEGGGWEEKGKHIWPRTDPGFRKGQWQRIWGGGGGGGGGGGAEPGTLVVSLKMISQDSWLSIVPSPMAC